ncbi:hypothetical protein QQS21_008249 [Conoideocrella luteorostrata]|uniref:NAD-dependent epimerase/dehydratase domain-containing protein n=1 Tax=Conoideocrella luteorostrata TaxID=1105319 RepID=A0AAJ0FYU2_9HYPO|nr:hypothetical protein QQS21_008249 [Conoideocrella luteorostrata]
MDREIVFITGSTGFIGAHVVAVTLAAGYRVRLSIRKPEQAQAVLDRYPEHASKIEAVVIEDITNAESFGQNLKDVSYVFHIASPMPGAGDDIEADFVRPAVRGTTAILNAALHFPSIKKVVVDSSCLALVPADSMGKPDVILKDNTGEVIPFNPQMQFPEGMQGRGIKYAGSKILAHQATRDWLAANQPSFVVNTLHAGFVLGDSLIQTSPENIDAINGLFWQSLFSTTPLVPAAWVHVRDVADAHIKAIRSVTASGQEFLLSQPASTWNGAVDFVKKTYPDLGCTLAPPFQGQWTADVTAAENILKLNFRSLETIITDVVDQQRRLEGDQQ